MPQYINKTALVAEIERRLWLLVPKMTFHQQRVELEKLLSFIDTLEVKDPYEQCIQYDSIKTGIQANAETYSFNIESELFNQLTKGEQQELWRKEIEQAYIIGGEAGVELARDIRYKENVEVKDSLELTVDDVKRLDALLIKMWNDKSDNKYEEVLKQFKTQKGK